MSSSERMREAMKNNAESNNNPVSAIQQKKFNKILKNVKCYARSS